MLTPKTNSQTCWPEETSHVMSGIIFFVCQTSWISQCFPAAIFNNFLSDPIRKQCSMSKRVQESNLKEGSAAASRSLWIWTSRVSGKFLRKRQEIQTARGIKVWTSMVLQPATGNRLRGPPTKGHWCMLKRGKSTSLFRFHLVLEKNVRSCRSKLKMDGEPNEFECNMFPGLTSLNKYPQKKPERSARTKHWTWEFSRSNHLHVKNYAKKFLKKNGKPQMIRWWNDSRNLGIQYSKSVSPLARGILGRKNNKGTIHFTVDATNTDLLYRTIHSANQLSIYGAVASWCDKFGLKPDKKVFKIVNDKILKEVESKEVNLKD